MNVQGKRKVIRVRGHHDTGEAVDWIVSAIAGTGEATVCFGPVHSTSERRRGKIYRATFQALNRVGLVSLNEYFGSDPSNECFDDARWVYVDVSVDSSTPTVTVEPTGDAIEIRGDNAQLVRTTKETS